MTFGLKTTSEQINQLPDKELNELFYKEPEAIVDDRLLPLQDFLKQQEKRLRQRGVTLLRLWDEYHAQYPDGFSRTSFYHHYNLWKKRVHPSMHMAHKKDTENCGEVMSFSVSKLLLRNQLRTLVIRIVTIWFDFIGGKKVYSKKTDHQNIDSQIFMIGVRFSPGQ
ncbi:hypothetical protein [Chryseolinea lacunae]|uniref:Transposase n=1 Tax=Chryseolinea lacunae TaxID=2801331 RepID=A0ABS1KZZ0_9BACT|nr:hypothetical protein [Chryseolinea lacunae]MBL0744833.1 hypothetical protein [Chryseolinea lacunae]